MASKPDRATEAEIRRALEAFGEGERYWDLIGPAMYQVAPTWKTVVVCVRHEPPYVAMIATIPQVPQLAWQCGLCGFRLFLAPPPQVLEVSDPRLPRSVC